MDMVLSILGGFFVLIGTLGLGYPRIIDKIKQMKKTKAEYYHEKFNKATPKNDERTLSSIVIFTLFLISGSVMIVVDNVF